MTHTHTQSLAVTHPSNTVGDIMILLAKPFLIHPHASLWRATVWVLGLFGAAPHHKSHGCGKDSESGLIREQYMFHIVHSPSFALLASLKLTFGIGTSDQRFWP